MKERNCKNCEYGLVIGNTVIATCEPDEDGNLPCGRRE